MKSTANTTSTAAPVQAQHYNVPDHVAHRHQHHGAEEADDAQHRFGNLRQKADLPIDNSNLGNEPFVSTNNNDFGACFYKNNCGGAGQSICSTFTLPPASSSSRASHSPSDLPMNTCNRNDFGASFYRNLDRYKGGLCDGSHRNIANNSGPSAKHDFGACCYAGFNCPNAKACTNLCVAGQQSRALYPFHERAGDFGACYYTQMSAK